MTNRGHILLMDDDATLRGLIASRLTHLGYSVTQAESGEEAIVRYEEAMAAEIPFDAVILDLVVPNGMGGEDALKKLLVIDPDVRAIATSGYVGQPSMTAFWAAGFKSILAKPFQARQLAQVLQEVLEKND